MSWQHFFMFSIPFSSFSRSLYYGCLFRVNPIFPGINHGYWLIMHRQAVCFSTVCMSCLTNQEWHHKKLPRSSNNFSRFFFFYPLFRRETYCFSKFGLYEFMNELNRVNCSAEFLGKSNRLTRYVRWKAHDVRFMNESHIERTFFPLVPGWQKISSYLGGYE